jgi:hypothetical protein
VFVTVAALLVLATPAPAATPPPPVPPEQPPPDPNDPASPSIARPATPPTTRAPSPPRCTVRGTARRDVLRGTARSDVICARAGADTVYARGSDVVDAGAGNDLVYARNGVPDLVRGGAGRDRAFVDGGFDHVVGVERVSRSGGFASASGASGGAQWLGPGLSSPPGRSLADADNQIPYSFESNWTRHRWVGQLVSSRYGPFCSGALVAPNIVLTAGHCVYYVDPSFGGLCIGGGNGGAFQDDFVNGGVSFLPYRQGNDRPYEFTARDAVPSLAWQSSVDNCEQSKPPDYGLLAMDYAMIVLRPDASGRNASDVVGGHFGLVAHYQGLWYWSIGYPGTGYFATWGGIYAHYCLSKLGGSSPHVWSGATYYEIGIGCFMTGGASGGPWIVDAGNNNRWEYIASVNSHCWTPEGGCKQYLAKNMWGPYFSRSVLDLLAFTKTL